MLDETVIHPFITLPSKRADAALHASWEIGDLLDIFKTVNHDDFELEAFASSVRLVMRRIRELNSVVMSVLGDDHLRSTEEMIEVIGAN